MTHRSLADELPPAVRSASAILVCGPPGAGKSTLAQELSATRRYIDKDRDGDALSPAIMQAAGYPADDRDSQIYKERAYPIAMLRLAMLTQHAQEAGENVVVEAPCLSQAITAGDHGMTLAGWLARKYGFPETMATVWLTAPDHIRRARIRKRGAARDVSKLADWSTYSATVPALPPHGVVDIIMATADGSAVRPAHQAAAEMRIPS